MLEIYFIAGIISLMFVIYFQDEIGLKFRVQEGYDKGNISAFFIGALIATLTLWPIVIPVACATWLYQRKKRKEKQ